MLQSATLVVTADLAELDISTADLEARIEVTLGGTRIVSVKQLLMQSCCLIFFLLISLLYQKGAQQMFDSVHSLLLK